MSGTRKAFLIIGGIILAIVLVSVIGIVILFSSLNNGPTVATNSVLVLKVSGSLPDYAPEDPTAKLFGGAPQDSFTGLLAQLRKAKIDKRIGGVLLDIDFLGIGWGKTDELREAIADFRTSGKPIYAYMEIGSNKEYYLATACDKIFLPPTGDLYINGFAAEAMFYRGSLDKLGIEPEVIKIGKYKNAPDQYTEKAMTEGQREVTNAILDDYYGRVVNTIAETRKKSVEDVKAVIDNAPYNAIQATEQSLIDGAKYRDEVNEELKKRLGYSDSDKLKFTTASDYKEVTPESLGLNNGERIAVIFAPGAISGGKSNDGTFGGTQSTGSDTLIKAIKDATDDTSIKAIVIRVDSPGGSALASDLIWHTIENAKAKKPVVTSMGDVAASGGYYIACNSNKIVAEPSTVTGSIGVFLGKPVVKGLYDFLGVSNEYTTRGKNAGLFKETEKWTPEERAVFERQANNIYYDNFVPKVATGRGKDKEYINSIAQGRVWTGFQAKEKGLIDEFGGLNKAIEIAKGLANLPAEKDVKRVVFPASKPFLASLFASDDDEATVMMKEQAQRDAIINTLPADAQRILRNAQMFDKMKRGETMAMMDFELTIK
ncbi:MAG: signal peptide peptidase SppA [Pyrinomonadaceae bacterium]|nr:signal peptide peptidase SppA [Pyrinomonadaceae bacterium]